MDRREGVDWLQRAAVQGKPEAIADLETLARAGIIIMEGIAPRRARRVGARAREQPCCVTSFAVEEPVTRRSKVADPKQSTVHKMLDDDFAEEYADDDAPSGDEYVVADDAAEPQGRRTRRLRS